MKKKKFINAALDLEYKTFVIYLTNLSVDLGDKVHPLKRVQIAYLKVDKALIKVSSKYVDFVNVFLPKLAIKLPKHTRINNHAIKLVDDLQLPCSSIYTLTLVELKMLKTYIKNNLINDFIRPSKSLIRAPIFFDKKLDRSLRLYIDYRDFNNLIIKNRYPLPLIGESLDRLGWTRCFS